MKNKILNSALLQIHIAVFLWGFTAILGKLITIDTIGLVLLRMSIAALGFLCLRQTILGLKRLSIRHLCILFFIGFIICIHWLCFYQSIKVFNSSSIALVCLGTGPMFVVWIEFFLRIKKRLSIQSILISIVALVGMYFISNGVSFHRFDSGHLGNFEWSMIFGILASFLAASFTIMNSKLSNVLNPPLISFIEMLSGALFLLAYHIFFRDFNFISNITASDTIYIFILSILCTNVPFLLSIYSLKKLEAFVVTLTVNLEPIYGLIFAAILFQEYKAFNIQFYIGSFMILISVFLPLIFGQWKKRMR